MIEGGSNLSHRLCPSCYSTVPSDIPSCKFCGAVQATPVRRAFEGGGNELSTGGHLDPRPTSGNRRLSDFSATTSGVARPDLNSAGLGDAEPTRTPAVQPQLTSPKGDRIIKSSNVLAASGCLLTLLVWVVVPLVVVLIALAMSSPEAALAVGGATLVVVAFFWWIFKKTGP